MLRPDVVAAVRRGHFHVWAVSTVEEGLEVFTGMPTGTRDASGAYPADSLYGRVDAKLGRLAEEVTRYGPADLGIGG